MTSVPAFTTTADALADRGTPIELPLGVSVDSEETVLALPDGSVCVLVGDEWGFLEFSIYRRVGRGWMDCDPTDRADGSTTYPPEALWVIGQLRDHRQIINVWAPGAGLGTPVDAAGLANLERGAVVLAVKAGNDWPDIYQWMAGEFTEQNPSDRDDGEFGWAPGQLADLAHAEGSELILAFTPPASKTF